MRWICTDNLPYEKVGDEIYCLSELAPFEIPETWEWCRVGDLFYNASGLSYKKDLLAKKSDSMVRVLRGGNIGDETYFFKEDDVFISNEYVKPELFLKKNYMITPAVSSIEHIGKIALIEQDYNDVVVGGFVLMLMPYFSDDVISQYLLYAFAAKNHRDNCRNITHKSGQAFYNLSREKLMNLPVPLPPHKEMLRIIHKLKIVLPIAIEYSKKEQDVNKLNTSFPDLLKKSILQEAVQGKLVPQDPADEPASVLLERIRAEKEQLIKAGKIKRDKHESVIFRRDNSHYEKRGSEEICIDEDIPFDCPQSWAWCRMGDLISVRGGKRLPAGAQLTTEKTDHVYIRVTDMKNGTVDLSDLHYISDDIYDSIKNYIIRSEDVYIVIVGSTIGKAGIVPYELDGMNLTENAARLTPILVNRDYLLLAIQTDLLQKQFIDRTNQVGQPKLALERLKTALIPLPPLNEQQRIIETYRTLVPIIQNA